MDQKQDKREPRTPNCPLVSRVLGPVTPHQPGFRPGPLQALTRGLAWKGISGLKSVGNRLQGPGEQGQRRQVVSMCPTSILYWLPAFMPGEV